jgi:hypothetical protein
VELQHASETKALEDVRVRRGHALAAREQAAAALSLVEQELARAETDAEGVMPVCFRPVNGLIRISEAKAAAEAARSSVAKVRISAVYLAAADLVAAGSRKYRHYNARERCAAAAAEGASGKAAPKLILPRFFSADFFVS